MLGAQERESQETTEADLGEMEDMEPEPLSREALLHPKKKHRSD